MRGTTVQVLGDHYVADLGLRLERDFSVVSRVSGVSPFTLGAPRDVGLEAADDDAPLTPRAGLDLNKDLLTTLRSAHADVLVVDLTGALRPVAAIGVGWYTAAPEETSWLADLVAAETAASRAIEPHLVAPSKELLGQFDAFARVVHDVYGPERVVLVTAHVAEFCWDGARLVPRGRIQEARAAAALLAGLERRFEQITGCRSIVISRSFLPCGDPGPTDLRLGPDFADALERAVVAVCRSAAPTPSTDLARVPSAGTSRFTEWAHRTLTRGLPYTGQLVDRRLAALSAISDGDAIALAALVAALPEDAAWPAVVDRLCRHPDSAPARRARTMFERNVDALSGYRYCFVEGLEDLSPEPRGVVFLPGGIVLRFDPAGAQAVELRHPRTSPWDHRRTIERGYVFSVDEIEDVLGSWPLYLERARRGDDAPFVLDHPDLAAFADSLLTVDYPDVLADERLCVTVAGRLPTDLDWRPRVDAGFLFEPDTRVCCLRSGFGDQLYYYVQARQAAERHGLRLFLDDLLYDNDELIARTPHIRPDVLPFTASSGVFSELFSRRLRTARVRGLQERRDNRSEYQRMGLHEMVLAVDRVHLRACYDRRQYPSALTVQVIDLAGYDRLVASPPGVLFLDVLAKPTLLGYRLLEHKADWESAIELAPLGSETAREIEAQMLASDAIVVHIRRGDRVALGMADGDAYYRDFVHRTAQLDHLEDKHWFVFSDDLDYCRTHRVELGLDVAGERITFVEGNHHYASIDDFHLMALGRAIVCGRSGFSAAAAMVSRRVEYIFGSGYSLTPGGDMWQRESLPLELQA
ncbi:hypothetical protein ROT00_09175 [Agromyces mediolanus]|uniref:hypothetical protein n=1 Tax=Agromyces mediolanus TaxID=41986 RepID=UPI0038366857